MQETHKPLPRPLPLGDIPQPTHEKYHVVKLPDDHWCKLGNDLVLPPQVQRILLRYGQYRFRYGVRGRSHGLLTLQGPPGTGKSDTMRWTADTTVRMLRTHGNALVVNAPALFDAHLGKSPRLVEELLADVTLSASRGLTFVLLDDAETLFISREQSLANGDPSDVAKATTALLHGLDRCRYNPNVLMLASVNLKGVSDVAVESRSDLILRFALPNVEQRLAILAQQMRGLAGERVLDTLATATEGWSGRQLNKLEMLAYLEGTADTPEALTTENFLSAVGLRPATEGTAAQAEAVQDAENSEPKKEQGPCVTSFNNGFQAEASPRKSRWSFAWRRYEPQRTS